MSIDSSLETPNVLSSFLRGRFSLSKLAAIFRSIGVGAVAVSAFIFMMQGYDDVSIDLRQWTWICLISIMGIAGFICRRFIDEIKGARIFFILAVALIPVQFSQLGGSVFDILTQQSEAVNFWAEGQTISSHLVTKIALSFVLAVAFAYTTFTILVRKASKRLTVLFFIINALILLPFRDSFEAFFVLSSITGLVLLLEPFVFKRHIAFRTLEGKILRLLLILPLAIVFVRNSLHVSSSAVFSSMIGVLSVALVYSIPSWFENGWIKNLARNFGGVLAGLSWLVFVMNLSIPHKEFALSLPIVVLCFELRRVTDNSKAFWCNGGCLVFSFLSLYVCIASLSVESAFILICGSVTILTTAMLLRLKVPLLIGVCTLVGSTVSIVILSLENTEISTWLTFAVGGMLLVLFSSVVEKHGRRAYRYFDKVRDFA